MAADSLILELRRLPTHENAARRVLHFANDVIKGTIDGARDRPEGARLCNWELQRIGNGQLFSGEVFTSQS